MRVVLNADVPKLGRRGEVKEVSDGYARNFLIPQKLGAVATDALIAQYERERGRQVTQSEKAQREAETLSRRLDGFTLTLSSKASPSGTLYAGLGPREIAEELRRRGFEVEAEWVKTPRAVKTVGVSRASIVIPKGHHVSITIKVLAANSQ